MTAPSETDRARRLYEQARAIGLAVQEATCEGLLRYLDAMLDHNRELNLTGVREPKEAEILHVLDSLALALVDVNPRRCLEIGSGNGFPKVLNCKPPPVPFHNTRR